MVDSPRGLTIVFLCAVGYWWKVNVVVTAKVAQLTILALLSLILTLTLSLAPTSLLDRPQSMPRLFHLMAVSSWFESSSKSSAFS